MRGLPIFSEVRDTDARAKAGAREVRDLGWLEGALRKHQARRELGQAPPMCLRHCFENPQRVGEFELTHIERLPVNPDEDPRFTLMGNKIYSDESAFEAAKDYDFRSAEISPDRGEELSTLALLKDKAPYFSYPNTIERLAPEAAATVAAFEAFRAKGWAAPQIWKGRVETFGVTTTALNYENKEGSMPAVDTKKEDTKAPSIEDRMEAMLAKFEERVMAKFEERFGKAAGMKSDKAEAAPDEVKKAGGREEPEKAEAKPEEKKPEAAQARGGPNDLLPPAVSQARPGEMFSAKPAGETLTKEEKLELFGLRSWAKRKENEEKVETFALEGEAALVSAGVTPDADIKSELRATAKDLGQLGVARNVATIVRYAKSQSRAPEAFGMLASGAVMTGTPFDTEVKNAVETFGARPDTKAKIMDLANQFRSQGEHFCRSTSFYDYCRGTPDINPAIMGDRGGFGRGN